VRRVVAVLTAISVIAIIPVVTGREAAAAAGTATEVATGGGGVDVCSGANLYLCEMTRLTEGDEGRAVSQLQGLLYLKRFYRGEIDGVFDREVAVSVATFHKATGPARSDATDRWGAVGNWKANPPSEVFSIDDWEQLRDFRLIPPKARLGQPNRVEIDIGHQLLYLILDGKVNAIIHVSTGYNPYHTPRTKHFANGSRFYHKHRYNGWSPKPGAWSIYKFWAYLGRDNNYGVHGYRQVPYYPASHGCIRVHVWEADYLHELFFINMPIHVWDE